MTTLKLSIIVPLYNVEKYIEQCIRSLEAQDIDKNEYEVLVIDDGSPDNSNLIVEEMRKEFDNIILYYKENGGLSSARNYGIEHAKGKYIWFVDSDDFIEKNVLGELLFQLETYDLDYIGFTIYDVRGENKRNGFEGFKRPSSIISGLEYINKYHIIQSAWGHVLKADIYQKYNLRFVEGIIHEDYEFVLRMYKYCGKMKFVDLPVYNYVIKESGSITSIKTYTQNRLSIDSWMVIIHSLQKCFKIKPDKYSYYVYFWINNCKYIALTNLLKRPLPFEEKIYIYNQYKSSGIFKIGKNRLSFKRKVRAWIYCIPFVFPILMWLFNKEGEY